MLKIAGMIAVFMLLSQPALAQNKKVVDGKFIVVSGVLVGTTVFDLETTFFTLENCPRDRVCREANSINRPFVHGGRLSAYSFQTSVDLAVIYYAYKLKEKDKKYWWVLPAVVSGAHVAAGTYNLKLHYSF